MPELGEPLSDRELDVLACMVQGASNKDIAAELFISENTVKVHLRRIYAKLGVSSRTEATTVALQKGLVAVPGLETTDPETAGAPPAPLPDPLAEAPTAVNHGETVMTEGVGETAVSRSPRLSPWRSAGLGIMVIIIMVLLGLLIWQQRNAAAPSAVATPATSCAEQPLGDSRWLTSHALPGGGRAAMATAAVGLNIYLVGGEDAQGVVNRVDFFETMDCQWQAGAPKPTAVSDITAAVLFGEIYVPGGRGVDGQPVSVVEVYSPANNLWRTVASLPVPLSSGLVLSQNGRLYLFGGWDGETYLDTAYEYDPTLDNWQELPPLDRPRAWAAGGVIGNLLYVVGGYDGASELNTCIAYDDTSQLWQECSPMLQSRAGAGAVVLLNKLYVLGGGLLPTSEVLFSEEYNPATDSWHMIETPWLQDSPKWFAPGISNVETRIYAFGGRQQETLLADTFVLRAVFQTFLPAFPTEP